MRSLLLAALGIIVPVVHAQEIVTLNTRGDATQSYLLVQPGGAPQAAAVLLPGGPGNIRLSMKGGEIRFGLKKPYRSEIN
ncbi:MAG TPA: hypothetical protein VKF40_19665 [Burkholderiales bacterium]|nr:hypothetical protein [Burkholderiales bacterium]